MPGTAKNARHTGVTSRTSEGVEQRKRLHKMRRQQQLRLLQRNADGIMNKILELDIRVQETSPDVLIIIQESKLKAAFITPRLNGYCHVKFDRVSNDGGEASFFCIKEGIIFEHIGDTSRDGTEACAIRVRMDKRHWTTITNVYCPPSRSHSSANVALNLEEVSTSPDSLTVGDFNAHCGLCDQIQPDDARGESLLEWATSHDLTILNDGTPTRLNKANTSSVQTGGLSSPDVSICGEKWWSKTSRRVTDPIENSDHIPIAININEQMKQGPIYKGRTRWRSNGVNWNSYTKMVEESINDNYQNLSDPKRLHYRDSTPP